ncbi:MAG TPA: hypothetical protein VJI67_01710 [archaeon]|nr:hypothetical protein [archaeon]HLD81458.1 hypothetical protein [archaeon]
MFYKKLTPETVDFARLQYARGNSLNEVKDALKTSLGISVCYQTIGKAFKRQGIVLRTKIEGIKLSSRKHLPNNEITKLYIENKISAIQLAKKFNSSKRTIRKILEESGVKLRSERERFQNTRKHARIMFGGDSNEKAYMTGLVVGDITLVKKSKYTLLLITHTTVDDFVSMFKKTFEKYGNIRVAKPKNNDTEVSV